MMKKLVKKIFFYPVLVKVYDYLNENYKIVKFSKQLSTSEFNTNIIFFFPFYSTGGAEKVHLDIIKVVKEKNPLVFFTGSSINDHFKSEFYSSAQCYDIYFCLRKHGFARRRFKKRLIHKLNNIKNLKIFG